MIIRTQTGGNRELRFAEWGNESQIPAPGSGWLSASGVPVTDTLAYGLPAVSNVIRSPAEIIASLPFLVYETGELRRRVEESWQWSLVHDKPSEECDSFEFFYDLVLSLEATQNAFVQKAKRGRRVFELYVLDPHTVTVRRNRDTGRKEYEVWTPQGIRRPFPDEILHVRGFTPRPGGVAGVSLIQMHRDPIGASVAMQQFEGDYFRNNAQPPFWFTGAQNRDHAQGLIDAHNAAHQGSGRQWKVGALWGTADIKSIPLALKDQQFVEAKRTSIEDACRIWRWPKQLLELTDEGPQPDENAWSSRFLKFYLLPRLRRIERAFAADPDLFAGAGLFGEFLTAALERADFVTRVRGYKDARQGSWITANEIRRMENMPPVEGGDEILITPTGSAPNPGSDAASTNGKGPREAVQALTEE